MSNDQLAAVIVALAVIVFAAHATGYLFERLRQPRLIGEILAGVLIGPFVLGRIAPGASEALLGKGGEPLELVLSFSYWLGLLLLMFISGSEVRRVLGSENRKPTFWLLTVGTPLPFFVALGIGSLLPMESLAGSAQEETAVLLVFSIAVAVTSIPVISRIFHDLRILHTRFASLILGAALLEDIVLWAVLAIATALASASALGQEVANPVTQHIGITLAYTAVGLLIGPGLLRRLRGSRWNVIERASPVAYALLVLLLYAGVASIIEVNLVFAAFLAGYGLVGGRAGSERKWFAVPLDAISKVALAIFVPVYFAIVGTQLELGAGFSMGLLVAFLLGSSFLCLGSIGLASLLAGFRGLEVVNIAVASNARGGPGIVLASVAFEAGIINGAFFTTLVLTAVFTSQFAGWWLGRVLRRGWPLLRDDVPDLIPVGSRDIDGESHDQPEESADSGLPRDQMMSIRDDVDPSNSRSSDTRPTD